LDICEEMANSYDVGELDGSKSRLDVAKMVSETIW
jgi:hypothetical protein